MSPRRFHRWGLIILCPASFFRWCGRARFCVRLTRSAALRRVLSGGGRLSLVGTFCLVADRESNPDVAGVVTCVNRSALPGSCSGAIQLFRGCWAGPSLAGPERGAPAGLHSVRGSPVLTRPLGTKKPATLGMAGLLVVTRFPAPSQLSHSGSNLCDKSGNCQASSSIH